MNNKKIVVVYHDNCSDGMGAALAAWLKFGEHAEYIPANYGDEIPDVKGKDLYVFDFSYAKDKVLDPALGAESITLLDHHKSAMEDWELGSYYYDTVNNIVIRFDMSKSGAVLAWEYLHSKKPVPIMFQHIQDNDLWQFKLHNTKPFIRNLRSHEHSIDSWNKLLNYTEEPEAYEAFIIEGLSQERMFNNQVNHLLTSAKLESVTINGITGVALNSNGLFASELGNKLSKISNTFGLTYSINNGVAYCSMRSRADGDCDVSQICRTYGGGGHKSAAGMKINIKTFLGEILCNSGNPSYCPELSDN